MNAAWIAAVESFDANYYLEHNPDVAKAVQVGQFASPLRHYLGHGYAEGRTSKSLSGPLQKLAIPNPYKLPPKELRARVHGAGDAQSFDGIGRIGVLDLMHALAIKNLTLPTHAEVLDFGCGSGRITRWLKVAFPEFDITGCDIDGEATEWANANTPNVARFFQNGHLPPLAIRSNSFDLIVAVSVFTHLPERMQIAWLGELWRVSKRGAVLALTVHDIHLSPRQNVHFAYCTLDDRSEGLPEFYQDAYHSDHYITKVWGSFFEIIENMPAAFNGHQNIVLCRRR